MARSVHRCDKRESARARKGAGEGERGNDTGKKREYERDGENERERARAREREQLPSSLLRVRPSRGERSTILGLVMLPGVSVFGC